MKDNNLYICKVPLTLKHLYTSPVERTIDKSFGSWWVVSKNMTTKTIVLAQSTDQNTRMQITLEMLDRHFEIETKITEPHKCFLYVGEVDCYQKPTPKTCEECRNQFWEM